jgi:outer membrane immunogenic protein
MLRSILVSSVALAAVAVSAPASAQDWSGFYAGGGVNFSSGSSDANVALGGAWSTESTALRNEFASDWSNELEPDGVGGGLFGGYNWQTAGGFVFGGEISYDFLNAEEVASTGMTPTTAFPGVSYNHGNSVQVDGMFAARANIGYAFDRMLIYGTVGFASADATVGAEVLSSHGYSKIGESSDWVSGVTYGVGAALQTSPNWFVSGQWTHSDFDDQTFTTVYRPGSSFTSPAYTETFTQDLSVDVIRIGVGYRF